MNAIRNILVIVDPAASHHPAVVKGALLAEKFGARLELFACNAELHPLKQVANGAPQSTFSLATELKGLLETLAVPLRARGLEVTTDAICAAIRSSSAARAARMRAARACARARS